MCAKTNFKRRLILNVLNESPEISLGHVPEGRCQYTQALSPLEATKSSGDYPETRIRTWST